LDPSVLLVGNCSNLAGEEGGPLAGARVAVRTAATASEALAQHRATPADLIVMDLDLPDATAEEFCDEVRADQMLREVSLLVLCGASESERRRAADCRANAHVVTPVDADALAREVLPLLSVQSRASYRVLVRVQVDEPQAARSFFCTSANLSASGILLEAPEPMRTGQAIGCSFFLPGKVRVEGRGRVVREGTTSQRRHFGVRFLELPQEAVQAIERFVADWTRPY
jgi:CheY-like chemotaxis protein